MCGLWRPGWGERQTRQEKKKPKGSAAHGRVPATGSRAWSAHKNLMPWVASAYARRLRPRGQLLKTPPTVGQEVRQVGPSPALPPVTLLAFPLAAQVRLGRTSPGAVAKTEGSRLTG